MQGEKEFIYHDSLRKTEAGVTFREKAMSQIKRRRNERKYENWENLSEGGRRYWYEVQGKTGWRVRYVKEVYADENTIRFYQEVFDNENVLVEVREKNPVDKGHHRI